VNGLRCYLASPCIRSMQPLSCRTSRRTISHNTFRGPVEKKKERGTRTEHADATKTCVRRHAPSRRVPRRPRHMPSMTYPLLKRATPIALPSFSPRIDAIDTIWTQPNLDRSRWGVHDTPTSQPEKGTFALRDASGAAVRSGARGVDASLAVAGYLLASVGLPGPPCT
jgi:hypothetical protein